MERGGMVESDTAYTPQPIRAPGTETALSCRPMAEESISVKNVMTSRG